MMIKDIIEAIGHDVEIVSKKKLELKYTWAFFLEISNKNIKPDAFIDFFANDNDTIFFDLKHIHCGRVKIESRHPIIFPLTVVPLNDKDSPLHNQYWYGEKGSVAAAFDYKRGESRKHAGRDLYAIYETTDVVAICDGIVKSFGWFYYDTYALVVHHKTTDGREFIVRYGEVSPDLVSELRKKDENGDFMTRTETRFKNRTNKNVYVLDVGKEIKQGQVIAKIGRLYPTIKNHSYSKKTAIETNMLHFELFTGSSKNGGFENTSNLTTSTGIYKRRDDLIDPLEILQEGYNNTFK